MGSNNQTYSSTVQHGL